MAASLCASVYPLRPLAELVEFLNNKRRDLPLALRTPGPYPYHGAYAEQARIDRYLFDETLVLLAEVFGSVVHAAQPIARLITGKNWVGKQAHVLRPGPELDPHYLCELLAYRDVGAPLAAARKPRLGRADAERILIPLPPLAEQQRIATLLGKAGQLRALRAKTNRQLEAFQRVAFLQRFGDPVSNSYRWPSLPFGALADFKRATAGVHKRLRAAPEAGCDVACYGAGGVIGWTERASVTGEHLLVAARGANLRTREQPVSRIVDGEFAFSDQVHAIAANARADLRYLQAAIELIELRPYLSGAQRALKRTALEKVFVPMPPLALQSDFRRLVECARTTLQSQQCSARGLDALYLMLRSRALRGELNWAVHH